MPALLAAAGLVERASAPAPAPASARRQPWRFAPGHTLGPRLTLTTCWPLWAGELATQRLVFLADQVDPPPAKLPLGDQPGG